MSPSDNLPRRFARIYTAAITDVMDEMGLRRQTLPSTIQPLAAGMRTAGYAFPARGRSYAGSPRERDQTLRRFLAMLGAAPADSVLVLAAHDEVAAHFGELSASWFRTRKVRGAVIDGATRDTASIVRMGFTTFVRYRIPQDSEPRGLCEGWGHPGQPPLIQRLADVVADPLAVPPLERRDRHAVDEHLVVEVVADREPGRSGSRDLLTLLDGVADLHGRAREMRVQRLQAQAVVDHDRVAVDREGLGEDDDALVGGRDRRLPRGREIVAEVHLAIDLAAGIDVGAQLGEVREHLGVPRLDERPLPERLVGRGGADLPFRLLGPAPKIAVDDQKAVGERLARRALGQELRDLGLEERVLDLDRVAGKLARADLGWNATRRGVAGFVGRADRQRDRRVEVPRERDQRDARAAIFRAVGERREHQRTGADVGAHGAGHPEPDGPGAPGRQIAGGGEQLDLRRREIDRDRVAGDRAILAPERPPEVVARPHLEGGVALAEPERAALHHEGNLHAPAEGALLLGYRRRRA